MKFTNVQKLQNLVFFPASDTLRSDLYKLGLDFLLVKIEGTLQFMVVTNQMRLIQQLAAKHGITSFTISDSRRQLFRLTKSESQYAEDLLVFFSAAYTPYKLGRLSKDKSKSGKPFLIVTEDNATYHYIVE